MVVVDVCLHSSMSFLVFDFVNKVLSVAEEGHIDGERDEEEEGSSGICSTAVLTRD